MGKGMKGESIQNPNSGKTERIFYLLPASFVVRALGFEKEGRRPIDQRNKMPRKERLEHSYRGLEQGEPRTAVCPATVGLLPFTFYLTFLDINFSPRLS